MALLELHELTVGGRLDADQMVVGTRKRAHQLVQLELHRGLLAPLCVLQHEHHRDSHAGAERCRRRPAGPRSKPVATITIQNTTTRPPTITAISGRVVSSPTRWTARLVRGRSGAGGVRTSRWLHPVRFTRSGAPDTEDGTRSPAVGGAARLHGEATWPTFRGPTTRPSDDPSPSSSDVGPSGAARAAEGFAAGRRGDRGDDGHPDRRQAKPGLDAGAASPLRSRGPAPRDHRPLRRGGARRSAPPRSRTTRSVVLPARSTAWSLLRDERVRSAESCTPA